MQPTNLNVAAIPFDIAWCNRDENLTSVEKIISRLNSDTDVIVLPELFATGFVYDPDTLHEIAETSTGVIMTTVRQWAKKYNAAIAGSFLCRVGSSIYNRAFFIEPGGDEVVYDKRHLFCISPESRLLSPGNERCPVIRFRGWNIAMVICYDIRFPVWCRNVGSLYDVLLVPANWPEARSYAWKHLLIARAIENQAYIVGANRAGTDPYGNYDNLSFIFDPTGLPVGDTDNKCGYVTASFSHDKLTELRRRLPVGNDAENFNICDL